MMRNTRAANYALRITQYALHPNQRSQPPKPMSTTFYHHLQRMLDQGLTVAVATITDVKGSVPREVGAKMIIHPLGQHLGTIGGGCGEADVIRAGLDVISDHTPRNVWVDLTEEISMNSLGVCGGVMNVFVEPWLPATETK